MTDFAGGRWTEARYKQFIRAALRQAFMRWPVKADVMKAARRPAENRSARTKWEYLCSSCDNWFLGSEVQVDHKVPCGSIDDLNVFVGRLFCEVDGLQVECKGCHRVKTAAERKKVKQ